MSGMPATGADVLDRDRHAGERPLVAGADGVGGRERAVGVEVDERVELAVERLDPPERRLDQLTRADLAGPDELRRARRRA